MSSFSVHLRSAVETSAVLLAPCSRAAVAAGSRERVDRLMVNAPIHPSRSQQTAARWHGVHFATPSKRSLLW